MYCMLLLGTLSVVFLGLKSVLTQAWVLLVGFPSTD